jgi:hypothetical protein
VTFLGKNGCWINELSDKSFLSSEFCLTNLEEILINSEENPLVEPIVSVESEKVMTLMSFIMYEENHQSCIKISKETLLKWLSWRLWLHVPREKHTNKARWLPNQTVCRSIDGTKACRYFLWTCLYSVASSKMHKQSVRGGISGTVKRAWKVRRTGYDSLLKHAHHGGDATSCDGLWAASAQRTTFCVIMSLTVRHSFVIEERPTVEWLSTISAYETIRVELTVECGNIVLHYSTVTPSALRRKHIEIVVATVGLSITFMETIVTELLTTLGAEEVLSVPGFV